MEGRGHKDRPSAQQLHRLQSELHLRGRGMVTPDEFRRLAKTDLRGYFESEESLDRALDLGLIIFSYASFHNYFKDSIFEAFLYHLVMQYRNCRDNAGQGLFEILGRWEHVVNRAAHNLAEEAHIERSKNVQRLDLFAKICFQEIGEITEGCLKPHIQLLYAMRALGAQQRMEQDKALEMARSEPFGKIIRELAEEDENLGVLYQHMLLGISLNQWRNIAHHSSYSATDEDSVTCVYGDAGQHTKTVTRRELAQTALAVHHLYGLHKLAHMFFLLDNFDQIQLHLRTDGESSDDSVAVQLVETAYMGGFEVVECERVKEPWQVLVRDSWGRSAPVVEKTFESLLPHFSALRRKMAIAAVDDEGFVLFGSRIVRKNAGGTGGEG